MFSKKPVESKYDITISTPALTVQQFNLEIRCATYQDDYAAIAKELKAKPIDGFSLTIEPFKFTVAINITASKDQADFMLRKLIAKINHNNGITMLENAAIILQFEQFLKANQLSSPYTPSKQGFSGPNGGSVRA